MRRLLSALLGALGIAEQREVTESLMSFKFVFTAFGFQRFSREIML